MQHQSIPKGLRAFQLTDGLLRARPRNNDGSHGRPRTVKFTSRRARVHAIVLHTRACRERATPLPRKASGRAAKAAMKPSSTRTCQTAIAIAADSGASGYAFPRSKDRRRSAQRVLLTLRSSTDCPSSSGQVGLRREFARLSAGLRPYRLAPTAPGKVATQPPGTTFRPSYRVIPPLFFRARPNDAPTEFSPQICDVTARPASRALAISAGIAWREQNTTRYEAG